MELSEAKELLNKCVRQELRDHAFGDVEVFWMLDGNEYASGYFGGGQGDVYFAGGQSVNYPESLQLRDCGSVGQIDRNDETGPDIFVEGYTMPALTLEGVREELTTPPKEMP